MNKRFLFLLLLIPLLLMLPLLLAAAPSKSLVISVAKDSYVVADFNDPGDREGLRERNLGSLDFVKTWYAWKILRDEKAASFVYLNFDLSPLKGKKVEEAALQLYARKVETNSANFVAAHFVRGDWSELTINFNNRPPFDPEPIIVVPIYGGQGWYTWEVTDVLAKEVERGVTEFSVALMLVDMVEGNEEQVIFNSKEAGDSIPRLVVVYGGTSLLPLGWILTLGGVVLVASGIVFLWRRKLVLISRGRG